MDVVAVNSEYPCCGQHARFTKAEVARHTVTRICAKCGAGWSVTRRKGRVVNGARVDTLEWKVKWP